MSLTARIYIASIIALGAAALGHGLSLWNSHDPTRLVCYLVLAMAASCLKVRLPGITGTMSVLFLFLLAGIVDLGLPETLLVGAVCAAIQSYWHAKVRPHVVQVAFGVANISFAVWAAYMVYIELLRLGPIAQPPFRLSLAASVFFLTNTFPVALVIALTERKSLRQVWSSCYLWSFAYYLVGAAIVEAFSFAERRLSWQVSLLLLPVVYVIYRSYWLYLDRLQSERRHAEEVASAHAGTVDALQTAMRANAKLDAVIQASPLAIVALDHEGIVTSWNSMAEHTLGWSPEEIVGRLFPLAEGRSSELIRDMIRRTLGGELVSGLETTQWRKDGSPFEATIWSAPLRGGDGISGILITVADISNHKRLEEQLRLSQKMEAVGRLAGGIAHDFNNLLTVINGYSAMLVDTLRDQPYAAAQAADILASGNRAAELVSQLLAFGRRQMIKPKAIEITQLIQDVNRMLHRIIGEHIEFRTALNPDAGWIRADVNQMEAIMLNLATNARDAMPRGGILSIDVDRLEVVPNHHPPQSGLAPGSYVRIIVSDTGHGMDAETQQHIFEPFFTTKQIGKGTGLGLSSVYGAVEQSGGRIFVGSRLGRGTTFSIYLPRIEPPHMVDSRKSDISDGSRGSETILLVEDEGAVRRMLREALSRAGYRIWESANGTEAIAQYGADSEKIDLIVTDIVMPGLNGIGLAEEFRRRRPAMKVIFMSGHSEEVISDQSGSESAPDLLQKPFVPDVLVRKVREVIDGSSNRPCSVLRRME